MNKGGFSFKRLIGVTRVKQNIARATGIPFTKSGRERKIGHMITGGGCSLAFLMLLSVFVLFFVIGCSTETGIEYPLRVSSVTAYNQTVFKDKRWIDHTEYKVYINHSGIQKVYMITDSCYKVGDILK